MGIVPNKTPKVAKLLFPSLVWEVPSNEKSIYLTFDDGPTPVITDWVLDTLNEYGAKATFFCIGKNIKQNPQIFNRILQEGHGIGNHTNNHLKGWNTKTSTYISDIKKCEKQITKHTDVKTTLFRPPYGKIKRKQIKKVQKLGYKIVMWNVLPVDWDKKVSVTQCLQNAVYYTKPGSIVVFHDSEKAARNMQYALPRVLQEFTNEGYKFKRIPELAQ